ncbi:YwqG family protein [Hymenobacter sublimis]|uniref:YwqG family protein n=1 Tax=Hymenobacter sublimis TaxID=2933777 RepID=A0ABY4JGS4_9BACT|nr:YwqG family protein [Hymenobacter sublimis]UPL51117.1 YwqG family protein [Hymenobacter sublimis]
MLKELELLQHWEKIKSVSQPCIRLHLAPEEEEDIPIGNSKMGGIPDLPPGCQWPTEQDPEKPLSFIAQINLAEVSVYDEQGLLPHQGLLSFFYSADQEAWGYDSKHRDKFKVLYYEGSPSELHRVSFPDTLEEDAQFEACTLIPQLEISLPSWDNNLLNFLTESEQDNLFGLEEGNTNKLFGHADTIQGSMELECELVTNGIYCGDPSGYASPQAKALEPNAGNWRLLLQVDSNEDECGMMWGDAGRLYFWIREQDLKTQNFDASWVILQCY